MIILASDHAGFGLKEKIKKHLISKGHKAEDLGAFSFESEDDYPQYAFKAAKKVALSNGNHQGILFCGSGAGMSIAANKVKGIRAVDAFNVYTAKKSRQDNDANILSLASRVIGAGEAKKIVDAWLTTPFSKSERHARRIKQISDFERR